VLQRNIQAMIRRIMAWRRYRSWRWAAPAVIGKENGAGFLRS
jgi:hypothetical protein